MRALNCRRLILLSGFFLICTEILGDSPRNRKQGWIPDNRNGTYTNPIIFADYSDPDVIRVGDDLYMTASFAGAGVHGYCQRRLQ